MVDDRPDNTPVAVGHTQEMSPTESLMRHAAGTAGVGAAGWGVATAAKTAYEFAKPKVVAVAEGAKATWGKVTDFFKTTVDRHILGPGGDAMSKAGKQSSAMKKSAEKFLKELPENSSKVAKLGGVITIATDAMALTAGVAQGDEAEARTGDAVAGIVGGGAAATIAGATAVTVAVVAGTALAPAALIAGTVALGAYAVGSFGGHMLRDSNGEVKKVTDEWGQAISDSAIGESFRNSGAGKAIDKAADGWDGFWRGVAKATGLAAKDPEVAQSALPLVADRSAVLQK